MHAAGHEARPGPPDEVTTGAELASLLREQHEELRTALERLPELSGAARDDEFWQVRRHLAVHAALESLLVLPEADHAAPGEATESVLAAEGLDTADPAFAAALEGMLSAHHRHTEQVEPRLPALRGELTRAQRDVTETAVALWLGEGDAYLGHDYRAMVDSARDQLEDAASPGHGPRP